MAKADTKDTSIRSRRVFLAGIASAAALPIAAGISTPAAAVDDPIFAAIDEFRHADAAWYAVVDGDIPDGLTDRRWGALSVVMRTRPTTPAGLAALTTIAREQADWLSAEGSCMLHEEFCALTATIDDAARGMSGLKPWSPPLSAEMAVLAQVETPSDAELIALAEQYAVAYKTYSGLSCAVDRMDEASRGYKKANRELDRAERAYMSLEKRIANLPANTHEGMLAKVRCARAYAGSEDPYGFADGSCQAAMARSVFADIARMSGATV